MSPAWRVEMPIDALADSAGLGTAAREAVHFLEVHTCPSVPPNGPHWWCLLPDGDEQLFFLQVAVTLYTRLGFMVALKKKKPSEKYLD